MSNNIKVLSYLGIICLLFIIFYLVGFMRGSYRRNQHRIAVKSAVRDSLSIEKTPNLSEEECQSRIIKRFRDIGYDLVVAEGKTLKFLLNKQDTENNYLGLLIFDLTAFISTIVLGVIAGNQEGFIGAGKKGEQLWYRMENPAKPVYFPPKKKPT